MKSVEIVYGYHESGHFSVAKAIQSAVEQLGISASLNKLFQGNSRNWTTLFEAFRSVNQQESVNFPDFFGSEDILIGIADAVRHQSLEIESDIIISTHPYASYALAEAIPPGRTLIYDVHTNYTPGPIFPHPRIDGYFTPIPRPELPYYFRSRSVECKVPLPQYLKPIEGQDNEKNDWLLALGADGWGDTSDLLRIEDILPEGAKLHVLAGRNYQAVNTVVPPTLMNVSVVPFQSDISEYLKRSKFVFSKASGSTVTEAIAHRCVPVFVKSFVPWELQAARHLVEAGVGIYFDDLIWMVSQFGDSTVWNRYVDKSKDFRKQIIDSAEKVASGVVAGRLWPTDQILRNPEIPAPCNDALGLLLQKKIRKWRFDAK